MSDDNSTNTTNNNNYDRRRDDWKSTVTAFGSIVTMLFLICGGFYGGSQILVRLATFQLTVTNRLDNLTISVKESKDDKVRLYALIDDLSKRVRTLELKQK